MHVPHAPTAVLSGFAIDKTSGYHDLPTNPWKGALPMDLPVLVLAYGAAAAVVLIFLLTALRGARRVDEQQDEELIAQLRAKRDALAARRPEPLPPLQHRDAEQPAERPLS